MCLWSDSRNRKRLSIRFALRRWFRDNHVSRLFLRVSRTFGLLRLVLGKGTTVRYSGSQYMEFPSYFLVDCSSSNICTGGFDDCYDLKQTSFDECSLYGIIGYLCCTVLIYFGRVVQWRSDGFTNCR